MSQNYKDEGTDTGTDTLRKGEPGSADVCRECVVRVTCLQTKADDVRDIVAQLKVCIVCGRWAYVAGVKAGAYLPVDAHKRCPILLGRAAKLVEAAYVCSGVCKECAAASPEFGGAVGAIDTSRFFMLPVSSYGPAAAVSDDPFAYMGEDFKKMHYDAVDNFAETLKKMGGLTPVSVPQEEEEAKGE